MLGPLLPGQLQTTNLRTCPRTVSRIQSYIPNMHLHRLAGTILIIAVGLGCVRSVPLSPPKLPGVTPVAGTAGTPPAGTPTATPAKTPEHSQEARSGRDCQISLLGTFPLNSAPSINQALENAGLTLTTPALHFTEEHLFLGILSRDCIVVFTDESD